MMHNLRAKKSSLRVPMIAGGIDRVFSELSLVDLRKSNRNGPCWLIACYCCHLKVSRC